MSDRDDPAPDGGATADDHALGRSMAALKANPRRLIEAVGLGVSTLLTLAMIGFLLAEWLRLYSTGAAVGYESYFVAGRWLDAQLGTIVFGFSVTWRALATGVLIGLVAPLIGTFIIHRQMALIGETLAHTAFAGVAAGVAIVALTGWTGGLIILDLGAQGSLLFVAMVVSALGALGLQWLSARSHTYGDVPIAIVLAGSFAIGSLLIHWSREFAPITVDVEGFLFGSLAIVTIEGARLVALMTVLVVAIVAVYFKQFVFITFDEQAARVARVSVTRFNTLLVVMTAVVVVGAMQILGVILVAAMLVVPAAAASQVAGSFRETVVVAVLVGQFAAVGGLLVALLARLPPGGSIVVVAIACYLVAIAASRHEVTSISTY